MTYEEWEAQLPEMITKDPVWNFHAYRKALFLYDLCWRDCEELMKDLRGRKVAGQLIGSVGSVSANIEEGYGRGFGADYARFLTISLGSARESKGWYYRGRKLLSKEVVEHRWQLLEEIISLLVTHIQKQKNRK